ncbi:Xaa-Pro peptidase family protein [Ureibacillus sp. FSL K6-8385]|uniref:Aminopeptidase P family protein n=1 Tax=Ureibacillus terrenus TaxID=118246 RepID=A0A540V677_9BACL|nr:Xaa-Pro peptidase family protein [Ureibacillus terrenus]MED3660754.1 Xaa-Pro peptidase family protein [Ureibacillus terrenus]MED3762942.1 Xaa-Pro peptidase family protein [Ureibacillus terrenus]TQE92256.1 aminopeptidase P family protein [Ureibacillus terrenus]
MNKLDKARKELEDRQVDALLITNPYNRRYMTGFTGTSGAAMISKKDAVFITDFRYTEQAKKQVKDFRIIQQENSILKEVAKIADEWKIQSLGFEKDTVTYGEFETLQELLKVDLVPLSGVIEKIRLIKTDEEIKIIKVACEIADAAFSHILNFIKPGVTELEVSNELEFFMRKQGATSSSFDTIVASGLRSALPHGVATDKVIEKGDLVTLDFGAVYNGYVSDITRTIAVGQPNEKLIDMYNAVLEAQMLALEKIGPGMTGIEADKIARDYLTEKGYGEAFGHSTGHGIGLEVHEGPNLSFRSSHVLEPNMVVTVEPGVYLPGIGGVRIEDDIVITEAGNERLTHSAKELIIL